MALVAVTGATGFVGQALVPRLLQAGNKVRILARQLPQFAPGAAGPVELVLGDLSQAAALERLVAGADAIVHLAGLIKARRSEEFFIVNREGVANLLAAIDPPSRPRFILLSSLAAREPSLSPYAASKRAGEEVLRHSAQALPWIAVRAPVVYGPGDRETLAFFRTVQRGLAPLAGDGSGRISAIHVADLADILAQLVAGELPPPDSYEVDDGHPNGYSLRDFAVQAGTALGKSVHPLRVPKFLMSLFALLQQAVSKVDGEARILSPAKVREIFHPDWVTQDRRLAQFFKWQARIALSEGFAETVAWYRRKHWL